MCIYGQHSPSKAYTIPKTATVVHSNADIVSGVVEGHDEFSMIPWNNKDYKKAYSIMWINKENTSFFYKNHFFIYTIS